MDLENLIIWLLSGVVIFFITRWYLTRSENIWKKAGITYTPSWQVPLGMVQMLFRPLHELVVKGYKTRMVVGHYFLGQPTLTIGDPELIRQVLVKDFQFFVDRMNLKTGDSVADNMLSALSGEKWKRTRSVMSPSFTTGKIKKMMSLIADSVDIIRKNLEKAAEAGAPVNMKRLFGAFAMDVIATTAFGVKIDSYNDPDNPFVVEAKQVFSKKRQMLGLFALIFGSITNLFQKRIADMFSSNFFRDVALKIVKERRKSGQVRNDFLQLLMDTTEEAKSSPKSTLNDRVDTSDTSISKTDSVITDVDKEEEETLKTNNYTGLSEVEVIAQCVSFFLAGYETVSSTLTLVAYLLALNEDCQNKLMSEIDEIFRQNDNQLSYDNLQEMKYLDNVISETMRMYPVAVGLQRMATADCTLGSNNIPIPKGTIVSIPVYALQHDPEYFPEPEKFNPDRFTQEEKAARNPYVYLPFGAGPRNCIGMRFALTDMKLCLAHLLRYFRFRKCSQTKVPLEFDVGQPLMRPKEILLVAEKRTDIAI